MKAGTRAPTKAAALRRRANTLLKQQRSVSGELRSDSGVRRLVHELQVHQIELELQNEELKQAELAARESAEKFTGLYDFAPIGYFSLDREARITEANLAAASLLGFERSRLVKRNFESFVPMADKPAFRVFLAGVFEAGGREHCEMTLRSGDGRPMEVRWDSVVSEPGSSCQVAMVEISWQKRAERDRLFLSQLESLGVLAGGIAHDFNNLLAIILLSIEVAGAEPGAFSGKAGKYLDEALRAVSLAQGLTRKIISLADGGTSAHRTVALPGLIREAVRIGLVDSKVQAGITLTDDLWAVQVDEEQIGQVIQNLVLNAREAMPGGGTIRVRAHNVTLDAAKEPLVPRGNYVCLCIADKGAGISREALPKIFEPYFSTKSRGMQKGMGLGLTICHAIMQRHKGAITVESKPGAGATFRLFLPVSSEI